MNLRQGGREKTPRRNETMIRLMQIIQCNKSEHWFFTLAKQKSPVRIPSFLYYSVFLLPVFSLPTLTETIPCATIWAPERENNEIWLVRFYSHNRTNDESLVSRQAYAPQTLSKVNPRKAMMPQMLEIKSFFRSSLLILIVE